MKRGRNLNAQYPSMATHAAPVMQGSTVHRALHDTDAHFHLEVLSVDTSSIWTQLIDC